MNIATEEGTEEHDPGDDPGTPMAKQPQTGRGLTPLSPNEHEAQVDNDMEEERTEEHNPDG
jgi:hypothetical protein